MLRSPHYDLESADIPSKNYTTEQQCHLLVPKEDGRLFPEYLLYCEGMPRPILRGMLHLFIACLFPVAVFHLFVEANGSFKGRCVALIYLFSNLWCCGFSALYHIGRWSVKTEIFLQKLDHCGIAIFAAGTNIPVSILLLPFNYGVVLASLSVGLCVWACWNVSQGRSGVWRLVTVAAAIAPFFPILYHHMSYFEFEAMIANTIFQAIGTVVFSTNYPDPVPSVFGYHEVFHVFTGFGVLCIYMCNWSVIRRTCNPYAQITDVGELLYVLFMQLKEQHEALFESLDTRY